MNAWFESVFGLWFVDPWRVLVGTAAGLAAMGRKGRAGLVPMVRKAMSPSKRAAKAS